MATTSIDLLSVISGIQVSQDDILQAELLLTQNLAAQDPTLDLRTGTAIRDLAVRPNATLLATINKALIYYWTQNSLVNVDDTTPTIFVDKILSNFFMTRFAGVNAIINARLYFAKATSVTLTTDLFFSPDNSLRYFPTVSSTYGANQLTFDPSVNQYYLSVDLRAENPGVSYNISSGSLIYFSNFNPFFLHAEINYLSTSATNTETNTQFITRAENTISTRNLINDPSIKSNLSSAFPIISQIKTVGMGDIEMIRDKVQVLPPSLGFPIWLHIGGCTDIYCNVPTVTSLLQFTTDANGVVQLTGPIYTVSVSDIPGGPLTDVITSSVPFQIFNANALILNPTSIISTGAGPTVVATVTCNSHGLSMGERFTMSGADQPAYNGTFTVASILSDTLFTYVVNGVPATPATTSSSFQLGMVNRTNEIGFSTRQVMNVDFSGIKKNIITVSSVTTGSGPYSTTVTVTSPAHGFSNGESITIAGLSIGNGIFTISSVATDTFQYTFSSATNPGTITFTTATAQSVHGNQVVSLNIYYFQEIDSIQTYLTDPANRVLASDQLARGFNLYMLDVQISGYGTTAPNQQIATTAFNKYLATLAPGQPFIMADVLADLYAAGITTIQTPLTITYNKYWRDVFAPTSGAITDVLVPNDSTSVFKLNTLVTSVLPI